MNKRTKVFFENTSSIHIHFQALRFSILSVNAKNRPRRGLKCNNNKISIYTRNCPSTSGGSDLLSDPALQEVKTTFINGCFAHNFHQMSQGWVESSQCCFSNHWSPFRIIIWDTYCTNKLMRNHSYQNILTHKKIGT